MNHATCDVYLPKAVETLIHGQCFLCCVNKVLSFGFMEAFTVGFKENTKYGKKGMKFSHGKHWIQESVFLIFRVFFVFLDKRNELSCSFIEASSEIGRKIK